MREFDDSMVDLKNLCPQCRSELKKATKGDFDTWECPAGHGIGLTVTEAWGHLQDDEINAVWKAARSATQTSALQSPALGSPMVAVTVLFDDDEIEGNEGPNAHLVTVDVAVEEQFLWFQVADGQNAPQDLPNPEPSAEELARIDEIKNQFGENILANMRSRNGLTEENLGYRFANQEAAEFYLTGLLGKIGDRAADRVAKAGE